ncbi:hypothetical protein DFS33DRAFT_1378827 [Desarmillaria ectypa]|nr:hypothetical protein DFS33DRAFT_1378827 [Desarmillaria ectypa]
MPCYRSCKKIVPHYMPAYDETRQNLSSSVHLLVCDISYAARHQPYYHSRRFMFEPGTIDPPVPRTPVIIPQDVIATTSFHYDLDDEFELEEEEEEEAEVSEEENDSDGGGEEDENEDEKAVEVIPAALLAYYAIPALLAFLVWIFYFA